jgi:hypothetical protein
MSADDGVAAYTAIQNSLQTLKWSAKMTVVISLASTVFRYENDRSY